MVDAREFLDPFHQMTASGTQPTETTFVAILTASGGPFGTSDKIEMIQRRLAWSLDNDDTAWGG